jgi:hypothetical protein
VLIRIDRTLEHIEGGAERVGRLAIKLCHVGSTPFKGVSGKSFKARFGLEVNTPVPWVVPMDVKPRQHDGAGRAGGAVANRAMEQPSEAPPYSEWSYCHLVTEFRERGLQPAGGSKETRSKGHLTALLAEHDEAGGRMIARHHQLPPNSTPWFASVHPMVRKLHNGTDGAPSSEADVRGGGSSAGLSTTLSGSSAGGGRVRPMRTAAVVSKLGLQTSERPAADWQGLLEVASASALDAALSKPVWDLDLDPCSGDLAASALADVDECAWRRIQALLPRSRSAASLSGIRGVKSTGGAHAPKGGTVSSECFRMVCADCSGARGSAGPVGTLKQAAVELFRHQQESHFDILRARQRALLEAHQKEEARKLKHQKEEARKLKQEAKGLAEMCAGFFQRSAGPAPPASSAPAKRKKGFQDRPTGSGLVILDEEEEEEEGEEEELLHMPRKQRRALKKQKKKAAAKVSAEQAKRDRTNERVILNLMDSVIDRVDQRVLAALLPCSPASLTAAPSKELLQKEEPLPLSGKERRQAKKREKARPAPPFSVLADAVVLLKSTGSLPSRHRGLADPPKPRPKSEGACLPCGERRRSTRRHDCPAPACRGDH